MKAFFCYYIPNFFPDFQTFIKKKKKKKKSSFIIKEVFSFVRIFYI